MQQDSRNFTQQGLTFDLSMFPQPGGDGPQVLIVIARVANKLKGAMGGNLLEQGAQFDGVQAAGGGDAEGSVGGEARRDDALEAGAELAEKENLQATFQARLHSAVRRFKGVAQGRYGGGLHHPKKSARNWRKDVGMFVRVQVGYADAGSLNLANLGQSLAFNLLPADPP